MALLLPQDSYHLVREAKVIQTRHTHTQTLAYIICKCIQLFLNDCLSNTRSVPGAICGIENTAVDTASTLIKITS